MILGNKYFYISANELNIEGSISKNLDIKILFLSFMITLFKKLRMNLTLFVL